MRLIDADKLYEMFTDSAISVSTEGLTGLDEKQAHAVACTLSACRDAIKRAPTVEPEPVNAKDTPIVPLEADADIQEIVQEYTVRCIKLLEKNIADTVLHAVDENKKLKEENATLKKQLSEYSDNRRTENIGFQSMQQSSLSAADAARYAVMTCANRNSVLSSPLTNCITPPMYYGIKK